MQPWHVAPSSRGHGDSNPNLEVLGGQWQHGLGELQPGEAANVW